MSNAEQQEFWNAQAGPIWVAQMENMDRALAPVLDHVLGAAHIRRGDRVLDIGCGAGTSTAAAARLAGHDGSACGLDISHALLAHARLSTADAPGLTFIQGDAQTFDFKPDQFDAMISRFGVMFFENTQAAFANIASGLRPGAQLSFATWGDIAENPYFTMPAAIAKTVIGAVPKTDPDAPGPFALRDSQKVVALLDTAGLVEITARALPMELTPPGDAAQVAQLLCDIGPAQGALTHFEAGDADRARLVAALIAGLEPFETPKGIRIPAQINLFTARTKG